MDAAEIIGLVADTIIILGALWIGILFRRTYRRSHETGTMVLSIIFFALALYFTITVVTIRGLGLENSFAWMESEAALELMMMVMIVALATVLSSVKAGWKGSRLTEKRDQHKAA